MLVGYMRVSTGSDRRVLSLRRDALVAAGVDERHLEVIRRMWHDLIRPIVSGNIRGNKPLGSTRRPIPAGSR
jgi:hypothetical protein